MPLQNRAAGVPDGCQRIPRVGIGDVVAAGLDEGLSLAVAPGERDVKRVCRAVGNKLAVIGVKPGGRGFEIGVGKGAAGVNVPHVVGPGKLQAVRRCGKVGFPLNLEADGGGNGVVDFGALQGGRSIADISGPAVTWRTVSVDGKFDFRGIVKAVALSIWRPSGFVDDVKDRVTKAAGGQFAAARSPTVPVGILADHRHVADFLAGTLAVVPFHPLFSVGSRGRVFVPGPFSTVAPVHADVPGAPANRLILQQVGTLVAPKRRYH